MMWKRDWSADYCCRQVAAAGMRLPKIAGLARWRSTMAASVWSGSMSWIRMQRSSPRPRLVRPVLANGAIKPREAINAARRLIEQLDRPPVGVICGHVPGFNAWLVAAALG